MKLSIGEKATRVLKLILGLRNPRVAALMAAYGFTDADFEEGWRLLHGVSRVKLGIDARVGLPNPDADTIERLDAWENRWFPVAAASLERRFPSLHAQLFKNLSQTSGPAVAVGVRTFVDRFDDLAAGAYGPEGAAAVELLRGRGLTEAVVDDARTLLEAVAKRAPIDLDADVDKEAIAKAESDLWAWYLEWSQIARVAITQRVLLKQMGFIASKSKSSPPGAPDDDDERDDPSPVSNGQAVPVIEH
ncbi:MAG: hypothetical protein KF819_00335 [Labilithrix sp.]|nr:hypothetical protein [Labilithrix sp.]